MFIDGMSLWKDDDWSSPTEYVIPGNSPAGIGNIRVISVKGINVGSLFGILGSLSNGMVTNDDF